MDNSIESSIPSFYKTFLTDVRSLFPELDLTYEENWLDQTLAESPEEMVKLLSKLGKALEISLITPKLLEVPEGLAIHEGSVLPELFYEFFSALFHMSGLRRHQPEGADAVSKNASVYVLVLRQFLLAFSKAEDIEPDPKEDDEVQEFIGRITHTPDIKLPGSVILIARRLLREFFLADGDLEACFSQWVQDPFGRHGPGAVAEGEEGFQKWMFRTLPGVNEKLFSYQPGIPVVEVQQASDYSLDVSRLCVVPKDFRGHRLICIEPKERMFAQQGLMQVIYQHAKVHPLVRTSIDFTNQAKSMSRSRNLKYSTIDLKDASDLVSKSLARLLLPKQIFALLTRYRSPRILAGSQILESYETFLTMGNALCFPMESLIFWALTIASMLYDDYGYKAPGKVCNSSIFESLTYSQLELLQYYARRVRVFGDDIIVPNGYAESVITTLEEAGLKVNHSKSCVNSLVRESCGSWWFNQVDVRITRFAYHKLSNTRVWISWAANARELFGCGFHNTANTILGLMAAMHSVPYGTCGLPGHMEIGELVRYNETLQRVETRVPTIRWDGRGARLAGLPGLYAWFTQQATSGLFQPDSVKEVEWSWVDIHTFEK